MFDRSIAFDKVNSLIKVSAIPCEVKMMESVLTFWFETIDRDNWYKGSKEIDDLIREQFDSTYGEVIAGETAFWRDTAKGRLAEIIVLDQFGRNMYRGTPKPFLYDSLALALAQEAVRGGHDRELDELERTFLYTPFMHSESTLIHEHAMELFKDLPAFEFEVRHKEVVDRFGRYPHRNDALRRKSTDEEVEWMKTHKGF